MTIASIDILRYQMGSALWHEQDDEQCIQDMRFGIDWCESTRDMVHEALDTILGDPAFPCRRFVYDSAIRETFSEDGARRWLGSLRDRLFGTPTPIHFFRYQLRKDMSKEPDDQLAIQNLRNSFAASQNARLLCRQALEIVLVHPGFDCFCLLSDWADRELPSEDDARRWFSRLWEEIFDDPVPTTRTGNG